MDDTTGLGPEHTSVYRLYDGTYRFCVHHYTGSSDIEHSAARVDLNVDDGSGSPTNYTYFPPAGQAADSKVWRVVDVVVSGGQVTSVTTLGDYQAVGMSAYNPAGESDGRTYSTAVSQSGSITKSVLNK